MAEVRQVKVFYDSMGDSLVVWFDNPENEYEVEETGNEVILMKDKNGKVIGFEKLNFFSQNKSLPIAFETLAI
ncbi:DUF2283 domain-containing protein [Cyanobacterium aponinum]|uniref:DUF2283 domain-containing protein n=2 Tax=Cyanobacterium aponinum TaxID=379064 RepID=K9Z582_CYAAP|nr:DUF2283 domain-containing protein [Cyanobacterium aponinum]AFZ54341.1 hypothetical protein Cyan10605_2256 [Cyanobacterium aponinum PCC 10605]MTF38716.1 DUF2283 domain-containing protein [Cyanobacterium aponinum 0216]